MGNSHEDLNKTYLKCSSLFVIINFCCSVLVLNFPRLVNYCFAQKLYLMGPLALTFLTLVTAQKKGN